MHGDSLCILSTEYLNEAPDTRARAMLKPLRLMVDRVREYSDSDSVRFGELLYAGEFISKLTTAAFVCSLEEDRDNHRYRLIHALVRASGLGDWSKALDDALVGPASKHLPPAMRDHSRAFTEKIGKGTWQYQSVKELNEIMKSLKKDYPALSEKTSLRSWFQTFSSSETKLAAMEHSFRQRAQAFALILLHRLTRLHPKTRYFLFLGYFSIEICLGNIDCRLTERFIAAC